MTRSLVPAASLVLALAAVASAAPDKAVPVWPVANPRLSQPGFVPSTNDRVISGVFGPRLKWGSPRYDHHEGLDFFAFFDPRFPQGDHPVLAILPGVVSEVILPPDPERTETGRKVVITHDVPWSAFGAPREWGNVVTGYLHLSQVGVREGERLEAGQELGRAGDSGYTTTVHLHLNAYRAGGRLINVNPARLFSPKRFQPVVVPLSPETVEVEWLERDVGQGTALVRVLLAYNAYTLDGFALEVDQDASRVVSFEQVSAEQRERRDQGAEDLLPNLRLFPLRYNGGGAIDRVNADSQPAGWPAARYPVEGGKGVRLGFDLLATGVPPKAKRFKLTVFGVAGERVAVKAPGFRNAR